MAPLHSYIINTLKLLCTYLELCLCFAWQKPKNIAVELDLSFYRWMYSVVSRDITVKCFSQPFSRFPFNRESWRSSATETVMCIIKFCLIQLLDKPFPLSPHVIFDFSNNSFCTVLQALCLCLTLLRLLEKYLLLSSISFPNWHLFSYCTVTAN